MHSHFSSTYTKIGTMQRRLAWPLCKDDTQIHEAFHILLRKKKVQIPELTRSKFKAQALADYVILASYFTSLYLSFIFCKVGIIILSIL